MKEDFETKKYYFFTHKTMKHAPTHNYLEVLLDFVGETNQKECMK